MSLEATSDRFDCEGDDDFFVTREAEQDAESVREILERVRDVARRAAAELIALKVVEYNVAGFENACGYQPGFRLTPQQMTEQMEHEAVNAFVPWLTSPVKELVEE